jgi:histidinol-phosphate/aromatic aminotransferase/cobyric acid decarboxylase-like protein
MTDALRRAFEAAGRLPEQDQNELAAAILEELAADERWEAALAGSQGALERLADEALCEHRAGRTKPFDPDAL